MPKERVCFSIFLSILIELRISTQEKRPNVVQHLQMEVQDFYEQKGLKNNLYLNCRS